jgi:hypothetical protein
MLNSSNNEKWNPSMGDYIPLASITEVKDFKTRIRRQTAIIILLSFSTISIFVAAIYYFAFV